MLLSRFFLKTFFIGSICSLIKNACLVVDQTLYDVPFVLSNNFSLLSNVSRAQWTAHCSLSWSVGVTAMLFVCLDSDFYDLVKGLGFLNGYVRSCLRILYCLGISMLA